MCHPGHGYESNVTLKVNAVVFFHIFSPKETIINVEDWFSATHQKSQTVLRNVLGQFELDELLAERDSINHRLQSILDAETDQWGIKVDSVEIKHLDLPQEMQRAMAKQAEAERERGARKSLPRKGSIKPQHGWLKRRTLWGSIP